MPSFLRRAAAAAFGCLRRNQRSRPASTRSRVVPQPVTPSPNTPAIPQNNAAPQSPVTTCNADIVYFDEITVGKNKTVYGFDDYTNASAGYPAPPPIPYRAGIIPWVSVETCKTTQIEAKIVPVTKYADVEFKSSDESKVTVFPKNATSGNQIIVITGVSEGESEITATCSGKIIGKAQVAVYPKKAATVAVRLVHEKDYNSTDVNMSDVTDFLEKVYKQAVFEFTTTKLSVATINFDTITTTRNSSGLITQTPGPDGKIDVEAWTSIEMDDVISGAKADSYDYNIFLVDNPSDKSNGFMDFNQRYGFVHADISPKPENTITHELGHGAFGLTHTDHDKENIMYPFIEINAYGRLRKDQWDKIHS